MTFYVPSKTQTILWLYKITLAQRPADILTLPTTSCHFPTASSWEISTTLTKSSSHQVIYLSLPWQLLQTQPGQMRTGKPSHWVTCKWSDSRRLMAVALREHRICQNRVAKEHLSTTAQFYWQQCCHSTTLIPWAILRWIMTLIITLIHFPKETPLFEPADGVRWH